tara:strand:+ start:2409 stop:3053 length:645 start_codon:yes stop_codon:yes gene_type:complete
MLRHTVMVASALAFAVVTLGAGQADAQTNRWRSEPTRISGYFTLQACCEGHFIDRDEGTLDFGGDADMDPGFGFGLRAERRVADFLALGGLFEMLAWKLDGDDDREFFVDVDVFAKVPFEVPLTNSMALEVYALLPFGFTGAFQNEGDESESAFGLNLGLLGGAMLILDSFGFFVELGFRHHSVFGEADLGVATRDYRFGLTQFAFNFGASVVF